MKKLIVLLIAAGLYTHAAKSQKVGDGTTVTATFSNVGNKDKDGVYQYGEDKETTVDLYLGTRKLIIHSEKPLTIEAEATALHYNEPNNEGDGSYWLWEARDSKNRTCLLRIDVYHSGEMDVIVVYNDISLLFGVPGTRDISSHLSSYFKED